MADKSTYNYPNLIGYITETQQRNLGLVNAVMATRPHVVRAGQHTEVIVLLQNMTDSAVDVSVTLHLPKRDDAGKQGCFLASASHLVVGIEPAEVGYISLPVHIVPGTAISRDYIVSVTLNVKALAKGVPVRSPESPAAFNPATLKAHDRLEKIEMLKKITFCNAGHNTTLHTSVIVLADKLGDETDLKPGWVSLWTIADHDDTRLLLEKYNDVMRRRIIPALRRKIILEPLRNKTKERFTSAGYPVTDAEADLIAHLMTLILEYSHPYDTGHDPASAGILNIYELVRKERFLPGEAPPQLPHWAIAMFHAIACDERFAQYPAKAIPYVAYDDLLRDAIEFGFKLVQQSTGESLGSDEEVALYTERVVEKLSYGHIDFVDVYMPLVLGGILSYNEVMLPDETVNTLYHEVGDLLPAREKEHTEENDQVFTLAHTIIDETYEKDGFRD